MPAKRPSTAALEGVGAGLEADKAAAMLEHVAEVSAALRHHDTATPEHHDTGTPGDHDTATPPRQNTTTARDFNTTRSGDVRRTVFLPRSSWIRLRRLALEHGVTASSLVRRAVIAWLDGPTGDGGG